MSVHRIEYRIANFEPKYYSGYSIDKDAIIWRGQKIPFVWSDVTSLDGSNLLGYAILEKREDGMYAIIELQNHFNAKLAYQFCKNHTITSLYAIVEDILFANRTMLKGKITKISCTLVGACLLDPFLNNCPVGEHYITIFNTDPVEVK